MKVTFQDQFLHGYIGMNEAGITHLYRATVAISKFITNRFIPLFSSTFFPGNITSFEKISLFYTCVIRLSSSKFQAGTLSCNYKSYQVPDISDSISSYYKQMALGHNERIALKKPFFQSFLVKSHVLEVP